MKRRPGLLRIAKWTGVNEADTTTIRRLSTLNVRESDADLSNAAI